MSDSARVSLGLRLLGIQLATFTVIWGALVVATLFQIYRSGQGAVDSDLRLIAQAIARLTPSDATAAQSQSIALAVRDLNREASDPPIENSEFAFRVWTADGRLLARSDESPTMNVAQPGAISESGSTTLPGWIALGQWSPDHRVYAVAGMSLQFYQRVRGGLWRSLLLPYLGIVSAMGMFLWFTLRIGLRPLNRIAGQIGARRADDLSPVENISGFREMQPIVDAHNEKLARIASLMAAERQFFDDAAHELRTPLSAISAQAHVLAYESDTDSRQTALQALESGIARAASALSKLLLMGRLDAAEALKLDKKHDVSAIAAGVVSSHRARAARRDQSVTCNCGLVVSAQCDVESIGTAIENLVDNALRYSPDGTNVTVTVRAHDGMCCVSVTDEGPGIPIAGRDGVFARFQRLPGTAAAGSGLGLAIVKRIATLHGGTVSVGDGDGGRGATFSFCWPQAHDQ